MNKAARKAVNLGVLRRHDPHISDILDSSSHVVVYKFDEDAQTSTTPTYGFFIMNRLGLDNLMADLTGDMALQLTSDYLIYRDEKDIHGIWIYEPNDRDRIGEKLLECRQMAKEETQSTSYPSAASPPTSMSNDQALSQTSSKSSTASAPTASAASTDPLTRMLSDAMSRARVSEASGAPLAPQSDGGIKSPLANILNNPPSTVQPLAAPISPSGPVQSPDAQPKNEVPSFLLSILAKDKDKPSGSQDVSSPPPQQQHAPKEMGAKQAMLLNSLTGAGPHPASTDRRDSRSNGVPLSAELLPASVMPSGLYSGNTGANTMNSGAFVQPPTSEHPSPNPAKLLSRPNGVLPHGSPMQAAAFAYSPGMMPSPLIMPPMQGGPLMRPPPPPPMPFQHPMMGPSMGMPPPPHQPPPPLAGSSFPADAMHAAMGAVGFMQQQQRGFVSQGSDILTKEEFSQQFLGLVRNDPEFMDVLYSNYTAVLARRG
ncbi:hypothetical protein BGX34_010610 [Mortierella sp. NVP85]|nr:hypothetical protein BGX34_010610 [Mortierella sp. NVP85]